MPLALIPKNHPTHRLSELYGMLNAKSRATFEFEAQFAVAMQAPHAILFPHARVAIQAAIEASRVQLPHVLVTAYSCVVVGHAIFLAGKIPRFVDIELDDFNSKATQMASRIDPLSGIGLVTHMYGNKVSMEEMEAKLPQIKFWVEDTSLGLHPAYRPKASKSVTVYSFGFNKILSTIHGGMAVTHDDELALRLRAIRDGLLVPKTVQKSFEMARFLGAKYLFTPSLYRVLDSVRELPILKGEIDTRNPDKPEWPETARFQFSSKAATLGLSQLRQREVFLGRRAYWAERYFEELQGISDLIPMQAFKDSHFSHYTVRVPNRDARQFREKMRAQGIEVGRTLDYALYEVPFYRKFKDIEFPASDRAAREIINLPNYPDLKDKQFEKIIRAVKSSV